MNQWLTVIRLVFIAPFLEIINPDNFKSMWHDIKVMPSVIHSFFDVKTIIYKLSFLYHAQAERRGEMGNVKQESRLVCVDCDQSSSLHYDQFRNDWFCLKCWPDGENRKVIVHRNGKALHKWVGQ